MIVSTFGPPSGSPPRRWRSDAAPSFGPLRGRRQGRGRGRAQSDAQMGRGVRKTVVGVSGHPAPVSAVVVRVFRPGPDDPNRASGEGADGSDPPFLTAGAVRRGRGCQPRCQAPWLTPPPPSGGSLPSSCILAGRLPGPHTGRTTSRDASAGWFLLTGGGMSSWCGWHWPAVFPVEDPVAVLVHYHTPYLYRAVVAWRCVAPVRAVSAR